VTFWDRVLSWWSRAYYEPPPPRPARVTWVVEPPEEDEPPDPENLPPDDLHECPSCDGQGQVVSRGWDGAPVWRDCVVCEGTGEV